MDANVKFYNSVGILCFLFGVLSTVPVEDSRSAAIQFKDNDHRSRHKRNASHDVDSETNGTNVNFIEVVTVSDTEVITKSWMKELLEGKWYGYESYLQRNLYKDNPNKQPTICMNNNTKDENGTILNEFICPMRSQSDDMVYCCGDVPQQRCCAKNMITKTGLTTSAPPSINDIDLATGIGIAVGFVLSISFCMFLYCCCCQRRPEIHDGIKLMWVRRSFGKELNRLEQPTYPNHLAIVSSRAGSRAGSRVGSRVGSRQGSRNPSRGPSPSVSRRASIEPQSPRRSTKAHSKDKHHLGVNVPSSSVVITVTTPSDEHGPTEPLLKTSEHNVQQQEC